ncbi:hypothetical protein ABK040_007244 [Willaertia magna]
MSPIDQYKNNLHTFPPDILAVISSFLLGSFSFYDNTIDSSQNITNLQNTQKSQQESEIYFYKNKIYLKDILPILKLMSVHPNLRENIYCNELIWKKLIFCLPDFCSSNLFENCILEDELEMAVKSLQLINCVCDVNLVTRIQISKTLKNFKCDKNEGDKSSLKKSVKNLDWTGWLIVNFPNVTELIYSGRFDSLQSLFLGKLKWEKLQKIHVTDFDVFDKLTLIYNNSLKHVTIMTSTKMDKFIEKLNTLQNTLQNVTTVDFTTPVGCNAIKKLHEDFLQNIITIKISLIEKDDNLFTQNILQKLHNVENLFIRQQMETLLFTMKLQNISLQKLKFLTIDKLKSLTLQNLNLNNLINLQLINIDELITENVNLQNLQNLTLKNLTNFDVNFLQNLNLQNLTITNIYLKFKLEIIENLKIKSITIQNCPNLDFYLKNCKNLNFLKLENCKTIYVENFQLKTVKLGFLQKKTEIKITYCNFLILKDIYFLNLNIENLNEFEINYSKNLNLNNLEIHNEIKSLQLILIDTMDTNNILNLLQCLKFTNLKLTLQKLNYTILQTSATFNFSKNIILTETEINNMKNILYFREMVNSIEHFNLESFYTKYSSSFIFNNFKDYNENNSDFNNLKYLKLGNSENYRIYLQESINSSLVVDWKKSNFVKLNYLEIIGSSYFNNFNEINYFNNLKYLIFDKCNNFKFNLNQFPKLNKLNILNCKDFNIFCKDPHFCIQSIEIKESNNANINMELSAISLRVIIINIKNYDNCFVKLINCPNLVFYKGNNSNNLVEKQTCSLQ